MRPLIRPLAAIVTAVAMLSLTPVAPAAEATPTRPISWEECPDRVTEPTAECGRIDVPMYHSDPHGPEISVGFVRIPAADESARRGTLFGNPGGPGGDGYTYFDGGSETFEWPDGIVNEWDRVAVQPRGLPGSTPVGCYGYGDDASFVDLYLREGGYLRELCEESDPGYIASLTTDNTVEDWEWVRAALEEESISLIGLSYGTFLASAYASRHPEHTDRVILDSAMDPALAWSGSMGVQEEGFENALREFTAWAAERDSTYGLGATPRTVYEAWSRRVISETGTSPVVTPPPVVEADLPQALAFSGDFGVRVINATAPFTNSVRVLTRQVLTGGNLSDSPTHSFTVAMLPSPEDWDSLARILNGTKPLPESDVTVEAMTDEEEDFEITSEFMQLLLACNENYHPNNLADIPKYAWTSLVSGDEFAGPAVMFSSGAVCAGTEPVGPLPELDGSRLQTRPLLIQATGDPQTPYEGRHTIAEAMDAHVVTVHGAGHGHVGLGNDTVDDLAVAYLRTGSTDVTDVDGLNRAAAG